MPAAKMRWLCVSFPVCIGRTSTSRRPICSQAPGLAQDDDRDKRNKNRAVMREMLERQPRDVLRLAIDCGIDEKIYNMSDKECTALARQINGCYGDSLRSPGPCLLHLTGLEEGGRIDKSLKHCFPGYESPSLLMKKSSESCVEVFKGEDLIYLSPSSYSVLQEVDRSKVYVIGGVVDRVVTKMLSEKVARKLNVPTARLPIKKYMVPKGNPHKLDLPINIVLKMLVSVSHDNDWKKALAEHFPMRKGWVLKDEARITI